MGCDIHGRVEFYNCHTKTWLSGSRFGDRCYAMFAEMACVRGDGGHIPRGWPKDASQLAQIEKEEWEVDGHTYSWLTHDEMKAIVARIRKKFKADAYTYDREWLVEGQYFDAADRYGEASVLTKCRYVFFFDN